MTSGLFAQTPPGVLLVNEISNGTKGTREFVELVVGATDNTVATADVRNWIIDDNNGIFNGTVAAGAGISGGHLRLADDPTWENVTPGTTIVLFNGSDFDSTATNPLFSNFEAASVAANGVLSTTNASGRPVIYVAVGLSTLVQSNNSIPTASPANGNYCGTGSYNNIGIWSDIGLRNTCQGDGIQTRCPGCIINLEGEPTFYHGVSYGTQMSEVTGGTFLNGAHIDLTDSTEDTLCAAQKDFYLDSATATLDPQNSNRWHFTGAASATPGESNTVANDQFIANLANYTYTYDACPQPEVPQTNNGVVMVTEISNGPSGSCEYAVLAVGPCLANPAADSVDIRGWIMDDNNGVFNNNTCGSGRGISTGHYRFAFDDVWAKVPVGSSIVLYNYDDNCYSLPTTPSTSPNSGGIYFEPVGGTTASPLPPNALIERYGSFPTSSTCGTYCNPSGTTPYVTASSWASTVGLGNSGDGFQVRCPGCNDINTGTPSFYHGFGYGPATGSAAFSSLAASTGNLGAPVINTSTGSNTRFYFDPSSVTAATDLGNPANWVSATAYAAASGGSIGLYSAALKTYLTGAPEDFPCCGGGGEARPAGTTKVINVAGKDMEVHAYPNPAGKVLNVDFTASGKVTVQLLDINGRVIATQEVTGRSSVNFNVSNYVPGIYTYKVISGKNVSTGKVMIAK
ncbi:MAG: hypothetical protein BGO69_03250 [Bacteroidetes bacterium 46-16]|nr:MAG: hypothetical protein BGO69_03250 [Bacteroidetes bacterium 46-16]